MYIESNLHNLITICIVYLNIVEISPISIVTHWKLNHDSGKIEKSFEEESQFDDDNQTRKMIKILSKKNRFNKSPSWKVVSETPDDRIQNFILCDGHNCDNSLHCDDIQLFTKYDRYKGIAHRYLHPVSPDTEIVLNIEDVELRRVYIKKLESKLMEMKVIAEAENDMLNTYIAISMFYRLVGETGPALDCLRKVTTMAPLDSTIVLSMAAILLRVRCLDDSLQLANRALEMIPKDPLQPSPSHYYLLLAKITVAYGDQRTIAIDYARKALSYQAISVKDKQQAIDILIAEGVQNPAGQLPSDILHPSSDVAPPAINEVTYGIIMLLISVVTLVITIGNAYLRKSGESGSTTPTIGGFSIPTLNFYTSIPDEDESSCHSTSRRSSNAGSVKVVSPALRVGRARNKRSKRRPKC